MAVRRGRLRRLHGQARESRAGEATVLAREDILYGFEGRKVVGLNAFTRARVGLRGQPKSVEDVVADTGITHIIYDDLWRETLEEGLDAESHYKTAEMKKFLDERCDVIAVIKDDYYGSSNRHRDNTILILKVRSGG